MAVKLDICLTRGIDLDPARRALAAALVTFSAEIGAKLIAEGVESAAELSTLVDLGVGWAQGYFLARPAPLQVHTHGVAAPGQTAAGLRRVAHQ